MRKDAGDAGAGIENGGFSSADDEILREGMANGLFQSRGTSIVVVAGAPSSGTKKVAQTRVTRVRATSMKKTLALFDFQNCASLDRVEIPCGQRGFVLDVGGEFDGAADSYVLKKP